VGRISTSPREAIRRTARGISRCLESRIGDTINGAAKQVSRNHSATPQGAILARTPFGRFGEKAELHGAVIFLISDAASGFVTGVTIPIDGGYLTNNIKSRMNLPDWSGTV
jgi:NAD(P)-dependent dehydrogenase (short-subunit alcohol dehydrogenase family)